MAMIDQIRTDMLTAAKSRDLETVKALRLLISALDEQGKRVVGFSDADALGVIKTEAKKRRDAIEIYEKAGEEVRAEQEKSELKVIEKYLPEQMSEEEVLKVVKEAVAKAGPEVNRGQVIGQVMGQIGKDKVDGAIVARLVGQELS